MLVQISSGIGGPIECARAVQLLFESLQKEFGDLVLCDAREAREPGCCTSILFSTESDLAFLEGTVEWICKSPFRPHHGRKNWFIHVSVIPEAETVVADGEIRFERFHCGGKGGQNVNKVETGVRLTHIPTGITVTATEERTQGQNRRIAHEKLRAILLARQNEENDRQKNTAWQEHAQLVRGNPVRVYRGEEFRLE